jgi:TrmH family RNA methyltransferase
LVLDACVASIDFDSILATPDYIKSSAAQSLLNTLPFPPIEVTPHLLEEFADSDSPRGILAVAKLVRGGMESVSWSSDSVVVYADGIQDPGNLGALARVAEATGVSSLVLAPTTVNPNHPRALRASTGSLLRLPVATQVYPHDLMASVPGQLKTDTVGLLPAGGESLYDAKLEPPLVLTLGSEGSGLSASTQDIVSMRISVPMRQPVESLNVVVSAAVVLYELHRRRMS